MSRPDDPEALIDAGLTPETTPVVITPPNEEIIEAAPEEPLAPPVPPAEPVEEGPYQKLADGGWQAVVDLGDGSGVQIYKDRTKDGVSRQLIEAQKNATKKIREQARKLKLERTPLVPDKEDPTPTFEGRSLTPEESFEMAQGFSDPAKAPQALNTLLEATFGAPAATVRQTLRRAAEQERWARAAAVAQTWISKHPEFYNNQNNREAFQAYVEKHGMAVTEKNLDIIFEDLTASGLLDVAPVEEVPTPVVVAPAAPAMPPATPATERSSAPVIPAARPRSAPSSTALSPRGSSVRTGIVTATAPVTGLTAEKYHKLSTGELRIKMRDPRFVADVDKLIAEGKL